MGSVIFVFLVSCRLLVFHVFRRVSRKLRPRKHRPQTSKTQTSDLENTDLRPQTSKTQTVFKTLTDENPESRCLYIASWQKPAILFSDKQEPNDQHTNLVPRLISLPVSRSSSAMKRKLHGGSKQWWLKRQCGKKLFVRCAHSRNICAVV